MTSELMHVKIVIGDLAGSCCRISRVSDLWLPTALLITDVQSGGLPLGAHPQPNFPCHLLPLFSVYIPQGHWYKR